MNVPKPIGVYGFTDHQSPNGHGFFKYDEFIHTDEDSVFLLENGNIIDRGKCVRHIEDWLTKAPTFQNTGPLDPYDWVWCAETKRMLKVSDLSAEEQLECTFNAKRITIGCYEVAPTISQETVDIIVTDNSDHLKRFYLMLHPSRTPCSKYV